MEMKRTFILVIAILSLFSLKAQIGGLSASKLSAYNAGTVEKFKSEIEPNLGIFGTNDSLNIWTISKFTGLRFTYGAATKLETGFITDCNLDYIQMA